MLGSQCDPNSSRQNSQLYLVHYASVVERKTDLVAGSRSLRNGGASSFKFEAHLAQDRLGFCRYCEGFSHGTYLSLVVPLPSTYASLSTFVAQLTIGIAHCSRRRTSKFNCVRRAVYCLVVTYASLSAFGALLSIKLFVQPSSYVKACLLRRAFHRLFTLRPST